LFSERLEVRARLWWGTPNLSRNRGSSRYRLERFYRYLARPHLLHRLREDFTLRSKDDPDDRWHCCSLWQRTLGNKWNAREFAQRHGCRVPALYWYGRRVGRVPLPSLPEHYVIRPAFADSRAGVYVFAESQELLRQIRYTRSDLMNELKRTHGSIARRPVLVEEFVRTESGEYRLPTEYKCHTFGETIGAVEVVQRTSNAGAAHAFYSPAWVRIQDRMNLHYPPADDVDPPRCLAELLGCARRLGAAYGTYVRVDQYATDRGCVFGEFSNRPYGGRGYTPYAERYFEELWRQAFPGQAAHAGSQ
jgi:hypothetical protein